MATADLMLGEWVPDMHLVFQVDNPPCNFGASQSMQAVGSSSAMDLSRTNSVIMKQEQDGMRSLTASCLLLQDQFGNLTLLGINAEDRLAIDVFKSKPDETLSRIEDLHACFNQVCCQPLTPCKAKLSGFQAACTDADHEHVCIYVYVTSSVLVGEGDN